MIRAEQAQRYSRTRRGPDLSGPSSSDQFRGLHTPSRHSADRRETAISLSRHRRMGADRRGSLHPPHPAAEVLTRPERHGGGHAAMPAPAPGQARRSRPRTKLHRDQARSPMQRLRGAGSPRANRRRKSLALHCSLSHTTRHVLGRPRLPGRSSLHVSRYLIAGKRPRVADSRISHAIRRVLMASILFPLNANPGANPRT
jgi:hypothetical protein